MTMPYSPSRAVYEGNNAATRFPFFFRVWDASQLVVTLTSPKGVTSEAAGWTADLDTAGGEIAYLHENAPLPDGWKLAITRNMPFTQEVNLVSASRFDPQVIEDALDQAAAERQQTLEMMRRAVILPATSSETPQDVVQAVYAARDDAQNANSASQAARAAAGQSAAEAAASANTAAQVVLDATENAINAATTQADRAQGAANAAATAASTAADDARQAIAEEINRASGEADKAAKDADLARRWASEEEDVPVQAGEYSARHYSEKAKEAVPDNLVNRINALELLCADPWSIFPIRIPVSIDGVTFGGSDGRRAIMPDEIEARENWVLCDGGSDGNGGTVPDLRERMLLGASGTYPAGSKGGYATHAHSLSGSVGGTTLTIAQLASHTHSYTYPSLRVGGGDNDNKARIGGTTDTSITGSSASHTHSISGMSGNASSLPPFYSMAFVMRIA